VDYGPGALLGLKVGQAAEVLGLDAAKAAELHETAVMQVHQAMLRGDVDALRRPGARAGLP
jgi:hypothetical protein